MQEKIMEYAKMLGGVEEGRGDLLKALCSAAEAELAGKLRSGITPELCGGAFPVAAAWLALAGMCAGECAQGAPPNWSAGAVSVSGGTPAEERAKALRGQALRLMAPYLRDEGFCFQGVRG